MLGCIMNRYVSGRQDGKANITYVTYIAMHTIAQYRMSARFVVLAFDCGSSATQSVGRIAMMPHIIYTRMERG